MPARLRIPPAQVMRGRSPEVHVSALAAARRRRDPRHTITPLVRAKCFNGDAQEIATVIATVSPIESKPTVDAA
jgi:hypothetical protein